MVVEDVCADMPFRVCPAAVGRSKIDAYAYAHACMREDSPKPITSDMHFCLLDLLLSTFDIKVVRNAAFVTCGHAFLDLPLARSAEGKIDNPLDPVVFSILSLPALCSVWMCHVYFPFYSDAQPLFLMLCLPVISPAPTRRPQNPTIKRSKVRTQEKQITTDHQNERTTEDLRLAQDTGSCSTCIC